MERSDRRSRPSERRAALRTAVVWEALLPLLAEGAPRTVVDIGGGTGGLAVRVAERGHHVTVVDPSPDALAALGRRADEAGVADRVTGRQGDLADLLEVVPAGTADLVLCHGVLGILEDPAAGLATLRRVLGEDGALSLLVGQRHSAVLARAMAGHFAQAKALLDHPVDHPVDPVEDRTTERTAERTIERIAERRFSAEEINALVQGAGYHVRTMHAVRVFTDLVPAALLESEPGAHRALLDLERAVAERPEYLPLATQLHLLAH